MIQFSHWPWGLAFFFLYLAVSWLSKGKTPSLKVPDVTSIGSRSKSLRLRAFYLLAWLRLLVILLFSLALSRPQFGDQAVQIHRPGIAMMMVLDRSSSMLDPMLYNGTEQNRLDVVKKVFQEFVTGNGKTLNGRPHDRIGLISFAGFVEERSPLTLDHQSLVHFTKGLDVAQRFEDGTMIGDAIYQASLRMIAYQGLLGAEGKQNLALKSKVMILLTDGQQSRGGMLPTKAAELAKSKGIKLYSIAIIGEESKGLLGNLFRLNNPFLDTSLIEEAARITGGAFFKVSTGEALEQVYQKINNLEKTEFEEHRVVYQERFQWFLLPAIVLLACDLGLRFGPLRRLP